MKKDGFNPRINSEGPKSIFKMNLEELEEQNKLMEKELKRKKIVVRGENNLESKTTVTKNSGSNDRDVKKLDSTTTATATANAKFSKSFAEFLKVEAFSSKNVQLVNLDELCKLYYFVEENGGFENGKQ
jgi:hypothetical protein